MRMEVWQRRHTNKRAIAESKMVAGGTWDAAAKDPRLGAALKSWAAAGDLPPVRASHGGGSSWDSAQHAAPRFAPGRTGGGAGPLSPAQQGRMSPIRHGGSQDGGGASVGPASDEEDDESRRGSLVGGAARNGAFAPFASSEGTPRL